MSEAAVTTEIVRPSDNRWETALLLAAALILVTFVTGYTALFGRDAPQQQLADWQISAYSDLQGVDQAIFGQLQVAVEEIRFMHADGGSWPTVEDFQEAFLPPFYRDLSWERNGSIQWRLVSAAPADSAGLTVYHGTGGLIEEQGAWLLILDHSHAGNEQVSETAIWWHPDAGAAAPGGIETASLVRGGWKEVIPYQGRDEVERLNAG